MTGDVQVQVTRRTVLRGGSLAVVGGVFGWLWARNSAAAKRTAGVGAANDYAYSPHSRSDSSGPGRRLVAVDAVPAGGGVIVRNARVVVTKDASGGIHGFSAVCTHQGCIVSSVRRGRIECPCHGSQFDATTGKVLAGPAPAALNPVDVVVVGGVVYAK
jgi:Rieske Fe-S protein